MSASAGLNIFHLSSQVYISLCNDMTSDLILLKFEIDISLKLIIIVCKPAAVINIQLNHHIILC